MLQIEPGLLGRVDLQVLRALRVGRDEGLLGPERAVGGRRGLPSVGARSGVAGDPFEFDKVR